MSTVNDIFLKARALLDEYTDEGSLIPEADVIDLQKKTIEFADMAQKELVSISDLYNTFEFANKPAPNLIDGNTFDIVDFIGETQYYPSENGVEGAKAYHIEANGDGSGTAAIEIQENQSGVWTTLVTINPTQTLVALTPFKGALTTLSDTNSIRIKITGTTHFKHANRALFSYPFADNLVPDYRAWFKVDMPADFKNVDQIITEEPSYNVNATYKFEKNRFLYVNYYFEGNIRINYKPIPATLTDIEDTIALDEITAQAIAYYVAARLAPFENKELVQFFETKYQEMKFENSNDVAEAQEEIVDAYGGCYYGDF